MLVFFVIVRIFLALFSEIPACFLRDGDGVTENYRRQEPPSPTPPKLTTLSMEELIENLKNQTQPGGGQEDSANRYSIVVTSTTVKRRTTPIRVSLEEDCDYIAYYCLKAYKTGRICGRTLYYNYHNFTNYCMLDYINCLERYEVWQIVHMGDCFDVEVLTNFEHHEYHDDLFLDHVYVIQE